MKHFDIIRYMIRPNNRRITVANAMNDMMSVMSAVVMVPSLECALDVVDFTHLLSSSDVHIFSVTVYL